MELSKDIVNNLVGRILTNLKESKNYSYLEPNFLQRAVKKAVLEERAILRKYVDGKISLNDKSKEFKILVKSSKAFVRELTNAFLKGKIITRKEKLMEMLEKDPIEGAHFLLQEHISTKERYNWYKFVYENIFSKVGKVKSLVDLGCGLNPLSYIFFEKYVEKPFHYYGNEIVKPVVEINNFFFEIMKVKGRIEFKDIFDFELKKADIYFLFKVLDSLESVEFNYSEKLLDRISSKKIVVSFPKQNLSGKVRISQRKREWFSKILKEKNWEYDTFEIETEKFFIIFKN